MEDNEIFDYEDMLYDRRYKKINIRLTADEKEKISNILQRLEKEYDVKEAQIVRNIILIQFPIMLGFTETKIFKLAHIVMEATGENKRIDKKIRKQTRDKMINIRVNEIEFKRIHELSEVFKKDTGLNFSQLMRGLLLTGFNEKLTREEHHITIFLKTNKIYKIVKKAFDEYKKLDIKLSLENYK